MRRELFPEPVEDTRENLAECPDCNSNLVQPIDWQEVPDEKEKVKWLLLCRCPNCFWTGEGLHSQDKIDPLEEDLDQGLTDILSDLRRLAYANMIDYCEKIGPLLLGKDSSGRDLIYPMDFGYPDA